mmetsp:Transcript_22680/g.80951  ORF Transcript_22680/g.80951 Transcript_22680/m.80951 type:complete len:281 (+) Transcript_22680:489-1331(+)
MRVLGARAVGCAPDVVPRHSLRDDDLVREGTRRGGLERARVRDEEPLDTGLAGPAGREALFDFVGGLPDAREMVGCDPGLCGAVGEGGVRKRVVAEVAVRAHVDADDDGRPVLAPRRKRVHRGGRALRQFLRRTRRAGHEALRRRAAAGLDALFCEPEAEERVPRVARRDVLRVRLEEYGEALCKRRVRDFVDLRVGAKEIGVGVLSERRRRRCAVGARHTGLVRFDDRIVICDGKRRKQLRAEERGRVGRPAEDEPAARGCGERDATEQPRELVAEARR